MTRRDMIKKNQVGFSDFRKWAMERKYYSPENPDISFSGIAFAGLAGSAIAADAASVGVVSPQPALALAGVLVARALRIGTFVTMIAYKTNFHKLPAQAAFNLIDKAKLIFTRTMDSIFRVPVDITRGKELGYGVDKIRFQSEGMVGIAIDKKTRFNPSTNIYMPSSSIEDNSPMFAKNKQIFNEIVQLIEDSTLSAADLEELDNYTKGVTKFSSGVKPGMLSDPRYDRMVNYAVLVPKLEQILDGIYSVQEQRESLKIDDAVSIEKIHLKEERSRILKPKGGDEKILAVGTLNEALTDSILQINNAIDVAVENGQNKAAVTQESFSIGDLVSAVDGTGTVTNCSDDKIEVRFSTQTGLTVKNYSLGELTNLSKGIDKIEEFVKENPIDGSLKDALAGVKALSKTNVPTVK